MLFQALTMGPAYLIFPIISISPAITVVMAMVLLRERISPLAVVGLVMALAAIVLFTVTGGESEDSSGPWLLLAILICVAWGVQAYFMRKTATIGVNEATTFGWMTISGLLLIPLALLSLGRIPLDFPWQAPALTAGTQVLNAVGALFLVMALARGKASIVAPTTNALAPADRRHLTDRLPDVAEPVRCDRHPAGAHRVDTDGLQRREARRGTDRGGAGTCDHRGAHVKPTIVLIGAGSVEFTRELLGDILSFPELGSVRVVLHDIDVERLETAEAIARATAGAAGASPEFVSTTDRRRALERADYVINVIQVGMHDATLRDFVIPERFELHQTIGDTVGIGGIFRGLRTFPVLAGIAADMAQVCPDAWLLNYTNPMAMNVTYLHHVAPKLQVLGLCHSVYWTMVGLCELIDVPYDDVSYWSAGVNHQAWVLRWERGGQNLYPLLDQRIASDPELRRRVRVDMYRRLGYYPTETSEHSSEYVPWYLHHADEVERLRINIGEYVGISEANLAEYRRMRNELASAETLAIDTTSTEYAPQVIHSLETGTPRVISANVVNNGLIDNLPGGIAVEVPTLLDPLGAHPMKVGALPPQCAALNRNFLNTVELTVRAAVDGDPRLVRAAAMVDPNTAATLNVDQIWELCDALTIAHGDLLPAPLRHNVSP